MLDRRVFLRFLGLAAGAATGAALFPAPQEVPCTVTIDVEAVPPYPRAIFLNQRSSYGWTSIKEPSFTHALSTIELPEHTHRVSVE